MSKGVPVSTHAKRQTRRRIALEATSLVAALGSAVFFSGWFIAHWSLSHAVLVTLLTAVGLILYWIWHRSRYPANINPPVAEVEPDDDDDDGGRWEWYWILAFVVSLIGVVIVGLVTSFLIALLVILGFGLGYSDVSDWGDVARATLAMLGVSAIVEFAIVIPLCKLWDLDFDAEPRPRSDFCPNE